MSRLWKKPKSGRLSRLMSEFQQSPKRGGSLVVETGFPASLLDLFFKNRDRLKKSSSKTKRIQRQIQTAPNASLPINPDVSLQKPVRSKIENVNLVDGGLTAEKDKPTSDRNGCVCSGGNVAFMLMAFKVLIVVVLTLNTKKRVTIGITLSAFALLLTELVAARVVTRFKLCNADTPRQKPLSSTHVENVILFDKVETSDDSKDEPEHVAVTQNSKDLSIRELLLKDEKSTSKSSKLKSKIMKKLRSYSKKKKKTTLIKEEETLSDVSRLVSENKSDINESERDKEKSTPPLIESNGDSMNRSVVIVIVLIGLLSGKIVAIGLTLSCLYLRSGAAKKYGRCI
ncbi:uncharacterized protein LOC108806659 [Raphanus sativus]|uniref:Uncharacterized protein LOC108806659 n=1 Tax=Raphanus sativus TaxID=3726 RepID=A0A6J0JH43_RAPSA|nr:uncharacterized protein LOC108806659 [Raphanus sativus]